jgi:hypothetical protein
MHHACSAQLDRSRAERLLDPQRIGRQWIAMRCAAWPAATHTRLVDKMGDDTRTESTEQRCCCHAPMRGLRLMLQVPSHVPTEFTALIMTDAPLPGYSLACHRRRLANEHTWRSSGGRASSQLLANSDVLSHRPCTPPMHTARPHNAVVAKIYVGEFCAPKACRS